MKTRNANDVPWEVVSGHRNGTIEFKRMLRGEPGRQNYEFSLAKTSGEFRTPRHRHNHDQVRIGLTGLTSYAPGKDLGPGQVGFFPEGTYYGMQHITGDPVVLALQSAGVSGERFLSYDELGASHKELTEVGEFFGDGVYRRNDGTGGNTDGFQAVWENAVGRPIHYEGARYDEPVIMNPGNYRWRPVPESPGVEKKLLGLFTEGLTELACLRWSPGASLTIHADGRPFLLYVTSGEVEAGGQSCPAETAIGLDPGEEATLSSGGGAEAYFIAMPKLAPATDEGEAAPAEPVAATV